MQVNGMTLHVPTGVILQECSIVIIGSTCNICGRHFKCESDVALHARWRHNEIIELTNKNVDQQNNDSYFEVTNEKCDICVKHLDNMVNLKAHKRRRHKYRKKARSLRLVIKIGGVIMSEIRLSRKHLKMQNNGYVVDTSTQADLLEDKKKRQHYSDANIDLSLSNHVVSDTRPHEATDRYTLDKYTSSEEDTITPHATAKGRSLAEISNAPNRNTISIDNGSCEECCDDIVFQINTTANMFIASTADNGNIHNKENSRRSNDREKKKAAESALLSKNNNIYYSSEISSYDPKTFVARLGKRGKSNEVFLSKPISSINRRHENPVKPVTSSELTDKRVSVAPIGTSTELMEIIIDNESNDNLDGSTITNRSNASLARLINGGIESASADANIDDEVQEVLRITRDSTQSDINHESPNRSEREILIQNTIREIYIPSTWQKTIYPERITSKFKANSNDTSESKMNNNGTSRYPSSVPTVKNICRFPPNETTLLCKTFNEKLNTYFRDLRRCEMKYCNNLPEINNNHVEQYAIHDHEDFCEPYRQTVLRTQYNDISKTDDNEATVINLVE